MRRTWFAALAALVIVPVVLAGCGSNAPTGPGSGVASQEAADDLAIQSTLSLDVVGTDLGSAVSSTPSGSTRRIVTPAHALWDTSYAHNGFTFDASRTYYDALNNALPGYGPLAVRVSWASRAFGERDGVQDTTVLGHTAALDIRGIQFGQDTLRVDGGCQDTLQNVFHSIDGLRTRYGYWRSGMNVAAVRLLKSQLQGGGGAVPISGTVTFVVSADRLRSNNRGDVEAHFDATVVITFNGTNQPDLVVNGTFRYHWHLDTGQIVRA